MEIQILRERPGDEAGIWQVNEQAFGRSTEAKLVDLLRQNCPEGVSLVALIEGRIVGHILFSPATIEGDGGLLAGAGLGPLAVLPAFQRQGVGSALMQAGLAEMQQAGQPYVVIVGHPSYYPRFGFQSPQPYGIRFEIDAGEAFMIYVFDEPAVRAHPGVARLRPEFLAAAAE